MVRGLGRAGGGDDLRELAADVHGAAAAKDGAHAAVETPGPRVRGAGQGARRKDLQEQGDDGEDRDDEALGDPHGDLLDSPQRVAGALSGKEGRRRPRPAHVGVNWGPEIHRFPAAHVPLDDLDTATVRRSPAWSKVRLPSQQCQAALPSRSAGH